MTRLSLERRSFLLAAAGISLAALTPAQLSAAILPSGSGQPDNPGTPLQKGAYTDGETDPFRRAVIEGDARAVERFLNADPALLYTRDAQGQSVYLLAAYAGQQAIMSLLETRGLILDVYESAAGGKIEQLNALLRVAPGLVKIPNPVGDTPLHVAALCGRSASIDNMIGSGPDFSMGNPKRKNATPAHLGLSSPDSAAAEAMAFAMIGNGLDPKVSTTDGDTVLHRAAATGYARVLRLLIQKGADPSARNSAGKTAIDIAQEAGKSDAVELLRNAGSISRDYYARRFSYDRKFAALRRDDTQGLPRDFVNIFTVVSHFNFDRVKKWLDLCPELLNTRPSWDELPVEAAAHMGRMDIGEYLLGRGASYSLCTSVVFGSLDEVKHMLREDPKRIHECGAHSFPLLWYTAFGNSRIDFAEYLIQAGADPHEDMRGRTVLHAAATAGHLELCRFFLEQGLDPLQRGVSFFGTQDAVEAADLGKHADVAAMLRDWIKQKGLHRS